MATHIRYSPRPIADYVKVLGTRRTGPACSAVLAGDVAAWNLAFLSHPYEIDALPREAQFPVLVRRTLETVMHTGAVDPYAPVSERVACLMALPAPQAVRRITELPCLPSVPLYIAYGQAWIATLHERSWKVQTPDQFPDEDLGDLRSAIALIHGFLRRG